MADNKSVSTARQLAVDVLIRHSMQDDFLGPVLDEYLENSNLSIEDSAFASRIVYGVTERRLTLDFMLNKNSSMKTGRMHPTVLWLLRTGCYQILYMDRVPNSAAVNETVNLSKKMKQARAAGFINAVLRSITRKKKEYSSTDKMIESIVPEEELLSIKTSCPSDLINMWKKAYDKETAHELAKSTLEIAPTYIRINTLKTSVEEFIEVLEKNNISWEKHSELPDCLIVKQGNMLKNLANLSENCYYHQDTASQWCCKALEVLPGQKVADVCAAPGGKTLTMAQYMDASGYLLSNDINSEKIKQLNKRIELFEIDIIETMTHDSATPWSKRIHGTFDRVLCDVVCSGLGVIRRKPEIKYKPLDQFKKLPQIQLDILQQSANLVKKGGFLQYSTCTLNNAENTKVVEKFLKNNKDFKKRNLKLESCFNALGKHPDFEITLFPHIHGSDGFYIAGFERC